MDGIHEFRHESILENATIIINVGGNPTGFDSADMQTFNGSTTGMIWNFYEATDLLITVSIDGV